MKRPQQPAYWQLDLFVCGMIAILILIMAAQIAPQWESLVDAGWAALMIVGMSVWVWANWSALCEAERAQRAGRKQDLTEAARLQVRTLPLTPVQRRFLEAIRRYRYE